MHSPRNRRPLVGPCLALVTVTVLAGACGNGGGSSNGASTKRSTPSTSSAKPPNAIVVGAEQFPTVLNTMTQEGSSEWGALIVGPTYARGYKILPDFTLQPWLFDKECTIPSQSPFTVDCTIRPEAKWSDGRPITADDFKFTWQTILDKKNNMATRDGYDQITDFKVISPTEFQEVFKRVFAPWRQLWAGNGTTVLPKHVLQSQDFNKVWNTCICDPKTKKPISSGPMLLTSYKPNDEVTLEPNPEYWGPKKATVKVVFKPYTDSNSEINSFRAGEVDMIYPQNQLGLRDSISNIDGAVYQSSLGPQWEHFDMLSSVKGLHDIAVRKAIATALPRRQIVERTVLSTNDKAEVLNNTQWMTNQHEYVPHWQIYPESGDVTAANTMLDDAGWKLNGDVREKNGVKLQFTVGVTAGNKARELTEQIIIEQLKKIGVKLTAKNSADILDTNLIAFDYQTIEFAWVGAPDPFDGNTIWESSGIPRPCKNIDNCTEGGQNYTRTRDAKVDADLMASDHEVDVAKRAQLFNDADEQLATNAVTSIPLYQKPTQLGYQKKITGVQDNPTTDGFTWNVEDWELTG